MSCGLPSRGRSTARRVPDHCLHPCCHMAPAWLVQRAGWQGAFFESEAEGGGCRRNRRCCWHVLHCRLGSTLVLADSLCRLGL